MDSLWFGVNTVTLGKIYYVSSDHGNKWQRERMNQHDIYANVQNKSGWQIWHKKQLSLYKPVLFDLGILQTVLKLHDRLMHKLTRHKL